MFRVNGKPAIGLGHLDARGRRCPGARPQHRSRRCTTINADLPLGIEPILVADQPHVVDHAISDFTTSLWQAIAIIMAVSFVSLGMRAGLVVALSIPLTLAIVFPIMQFVRHRSAAHFAGRADHRAWPAGRRRDDHDRRHDLAARRRRQQGAGGDVCLQDLVAMPMLTGSFVTAAGFVPIGFAKSSAGEYTFSIFAVVGVALIVSWFVAVLFAPLLGVGAARQTPKADSR